ncbi:MAG: ABC transporter substrate-binding protein, partial [Dehalococcoidia bacterium]
AVSILNPPHEPSDAKAFAYDPAKAKQLLADAGFPNGFTTTMDFPQGRYIKDKEIAQAIIQDLAKVGIKANPAPQEWSVYAGDKLAKQNPDDMFFLGLGAPFTGQEELNFLEKSYSLQETHWVNDPYEALFTQLLNTADEKKRQDVMNQMHAIAWDECPWLWIYHQVDYYGVSKRLNWSARPDEGIYGFEATYKA